MSRQDGQYYEIDGHVIPSRRAMERANEWAKKMGWLAPYIISDYYDDDEPSAPPAKQT